MKPPVEGSEGARAAALMLPAELTQREASACLELLLQGVRARQMADGETIVVDASLLERFDSSALAVLLECRRECVALGRRFAVRALPARLRALSGLYGVEQLLLAEPAA